ncbi:hypothetical protein CsSME_00015795 [Camellia sinensis var. sinensis]
MQLLIAYDSFCVEGWLFMVMMNLMIQKDIVNAAACETINDIIKDLDNEFFSILVDESRDISVKEQMAVVLRYVDKKGIVIERFLGYDGASNMQGEFNGLKALILR